MSPNAPQWLVALEASGVGAAIRQSPLIYPAANVLHVMALAMFAGAVVVMDLALLGAFRRHAPVEIVRPARRATIAALLLLLATGSILFTAEASHVALNPVFQAKAALIALGIANALLLGRMPPAALASWPSERPLPARVRLAAALSLTIWLAVAGLGRTIAYF